MSHLFFIGLGGFIGAVLRYTINQLFISLNQKFDFPIGLFIINFTGCYLIGLFDFYLQDKQFISENTRQFLMIGLLGSYTTFSTFALEFYQFAIKGDWVKAIFWVLLSVVCCLFGIFLGYQSYKVL